MKGFGAGMVKVPAIITPALRAATGPLSIRQAARLLNLSGAQVYGWFERGLPVVRLRQGRGNDKVMVDAAELREWLKENQPTVWIQADEDGLLCTRSEYLQRLGMCQNMLKRWRYEAYLRLVHHRTGRRRPDAGAGGARCYWRIGRAGDCHATAWGVGAMSDLVQLALSLCATAGTLAEVVKKYEFHGHLLDRERLRKLVAAVVANCEELTEALDDGIS